MRSIARAISLIAPLVFGCYSTYVVKPTELPKLSGSYDNSHSVTAGRTTVTVIDESTRQLIAPDGTTVEVKGETKADVVADGASYHFDHPVIAEVNGNSLVVRGSNQANTFDLADVSTASVTYYDRTKTGWFVFGTSMVASAIMLAVLFASMPDVEHSISERRSA